jgi:hypothetical protein
MKLSKILLICPMCLLVTEASANLREYGESSDMPIGIRIRDEWGGITAEDCGIHASLYEDFKPQSEDLSPSNDMCFPTHR